jgi:hypothetical protein
MDIQATLTTYCDLMEEVKGRTQLLLDLTFTPQKNNLPQWAAIELGQLQIRVICELIAIGCLLAHGDIKGTRSGKIVKAYQADLIFNALEKLHPDFYPAPSKQVIIPNKPIDLIPITDGFLTKEELIKSYHVAASFLHRGNLQAVIGKTLKVVQQQSIKDWSDRLITLLNHHHIFLSDPDEPDPPRVDGRPMPRKQIICLMQGSDDGKVHASFFNRLYTPPSQGK